MRRTVLALIVASASILGGVAAAPARAGDAPADALAAADRHEAEGRALLERGEKVAAAKHMMEAWALRARAWSRESAPRDVANIAMLREQSAAAEAMARDLRAAGKVADAEAKIDEATRLWKEADALELEVRRRAEAEARKMSPADEARLRDERQDAARKAARSGPGTGRDYVKLDTTDEVAARRRALEAKVKRLEAEAGNLWAAGKVAEAEERLAKATALRQELKALAKEGAPGSDGATEAEAKARKARDEAVARARKEQEQAKEKAKAEARRAAEAALVGEVKQLRRQFDELRAVVEELRARWAAAATPAAPAAPTAPTAPTAPAPAK